MTGSECDAYAALGDPCEDTLTATITPIAAPANAASGWRYWEDKVELHGPAYVWSYQASAEIATNGSSAWLQTPVSCGSGFSAGYAFSDKWCGSWNNGGKGGYMNFGFNVTVSFLVKGSPASQAYWMRGDQYDNGSFKQSWGKF